MEADQSRAIAAKKISADTARYVNDYCTHKIRRLGPKIAKQYGQSDEGVARGFVYMAMLAGLVAVLTSVIEGVAQNNPELAATLREDIIGKIQKAGVH